MDGNENAATTAAFAHDGATTAPNASPYEAVYRRQTAVDLAIRAIGERGFNTDKLLELSQKIDDFLAGGKYEVTSK